MQLQALLCSTELLPVMQVAQHTLTQLKGCGQEMVGLLSLQLLTWPHVGKLRDVSVCGRYYAFSVKWAFFRSYNFDSP